MSPLSPLQRRPNLPAATKIVDNWRTVLLEYDIRRGNIIVDDVERMKVTNTSQGSVQTRFCGIVNGQAAAGEKVGFAQIAGVKLTYNAGNKCLTLAYWCVGSPCKRRCPYQIHGYALAIEGPYIPMPVYERTRGVSLARSAFEFTLTSARISEKVF